MQLRYKKDASLGGVGRGENHRISHGASSEASLDTFLDSVRDDLKNRKPYGVSSKASGDTSLDGVGRGHMVASYGVSSEVSNNIVPQSRENATGLLRKIQNNTDYAAVAV